MSLTICVVLGTRPEAIKLAPVIKSLQKRKAVKVLVCLTGQHEHMVEDILSFFDIKTDYNLKIMQENQSLFDITTRVLSGLEPIYKKEKPDRVIVQGDTTSAFCGALAAYYLQIPVAHIEAGLRSFNAYAPFPEELNRKWIASIAHYHFAPTLSAQKNLKKENITQNIWMVGNTGIDALVWALKHTHCPSSLQEIDFTKKLILLTCHRRENKGQGRSDILKAAQHIAKENPDVTILYVTHPNTAQENIIEKNIHFLPPLKYPDFVFLLNKSYLVLTDSGGLQEEALFLGKPVIVTRQVTERTEGVSSGNSVVAGTNSDHIITLLTTLLENTHVYKKMSKSSTAYGDGSAAEKISDIMINK